MRSTGKRALVLAATLAFSWSAFAGPWQNVRASQFLGSAVLDRAGESVGELHEMVIDMNTARVHYAVLEMGGILGLGGKLIPYPLNALSPRQGGERIVLDVAPRELADALGFERDRWPAWTDPVWDRADDARRGSPAAGATAVHRQPRFLRTQELLGREVRDRDGNAMGQLRDVVLDLEAGIAREALITGERQWRVPFQQLHTQTGAPGQPLVYEGDR